MFYLKPIYKSFIKEKARLSPDKDLDKRHKLLEQSNIPLYNKKKALDETGFNCPANASVWIMMYVITFGICVLIPFLALFISRKISVYILLIVFISFILGAFITGGTALNSKFHKSPIVYKSLFYKMFIGGTDTKWYKYRVELLTHSFLDEVEGGRIDAIYVYFITFISPESNKRYIMEISEAEHALYSEYIIDAAAVGICGKDIVGVYFYKEGESLNETLPKVSKK